MTKGGKKVQPPQASFLESELADKLASIDGMKKLIETSKKVNLLEAQIAESEANVAKVENWNYALS